MENWDEVWRRNQFLCSGLAHRFPDSKILFVGLSRDISYALRHGQWNEMRQPAKTAIINHPNITILRPLKFLPNTIAWCRRINEWHLRSQMRRAAQQLRLQQPLLWLNPHYAVHMVGQMGECAAVYDITDDWISLTQSDRLRQLTVKQDAELCHRANAVLVCSEKLFALKRDMTSSLHLLPNGVDIAHYEMVDSVRPLPDEAAHWPHPILGYTGTIHPDRVDVKLIAALGKAFQEGTVALVGPDLLPPEIKASLEAVSNVRFTGPVAYSEVPLYMQSFDVCITPHLVTPFTESLNPIKLWEYLACGKPIVSTNIAGFRDYPDVVRIADDTDAFIAGCRDALDDINALSDTRKAIAAQNTWGKRIDQLLEILRPWSARNT